MVNPQMPQEMSRSLYKTLGTATVRKLASKQPQQVSTAGMTNYRIGPHRTTSDHIGPHRTCGREMRENWGK